MGQEHSPLLHHRTNVWEELVVWPRSAPHPAVIPLQTWWRNWVQILSLTRELTQNLGTKGMFVLFLFYFPFFIFLFFEGMAVRFWPLLFDSASVVLSVSSLNGLSWVFDIFIWMKIVSSLSDSPWYLLLSSYSFSSVLFSSFPKLGWSSFALQPCFSCIFLQIQVCFVPYPSQILFSTGLKITLPKGNSLHTTSWVMLDIVYITRDLAPMIKDTKLTVITDYQFLGCAWWYCSC